MITGRLPFQKSDGIEFLRAHINEAPPRPSQVAPERAIPPAVEALVMRALEKQPSKRFDSTDAMIAAIDRAAGNKPMRVGRRVPPLAWAAALALIVMGLVIFFFLR
jgi:serine/threonine-protein kinase